jgi:alanine racemase
MNFPRGRAKVTRACDQAKPLAMPAPPNARLIVDTAALVANWRRLAAAGGPAACGAAVKADGYGLGAVGVANALVAAGCRDLFVAHWHEVAALDGLPTDVRIAVLHGVGPDEMSAAMASRAVPVLNTPEQVALWKPTGRPCDVMVDTGINRLGLSADEAVSGLLDGLAIDTLHSHLACAETPAHPLNAQQQARFAVLAARIPARRQALANSAGIALGPGYHFSLTRPGIGLYGGGDAPGGGRFLLVARLAARILQMRDLAAGETVGYGATFTAPRPMQLAIVALGYADGYPRALSGGHGLARVDGRPCPGVGRISMDLAAFDVTGAGHVEEGGFLEVDFDLAAIAAATGRTEYELLTGLGARYAREYR